MNLSGEEDDVGVAELVQVFVGGGEADARLVAQVIYQSASRDGGSRDARRARRPALCWKTSNLLSLSGSLRGPI